MSLAPSTQLGPYTVNLPLGAGGMGEVYRARDTRLGRDVAIKVLPASVSSDQERLRRFEQEARAAGILNHPNILAIYDIGTHDGAPYVVSELLEGETLRDRLTEGPLPTRKALDYALQIAKGLAAAHEKGIVHRDLKPENLFVTRDGRVKILDFGLAKLVHTVGAESPQTDAATLRFNSEPGKILGTAGYMSPEQVRGLPVDHRADVFSFGAVFYEMLTGKRAFKGDSTVETMNAILKEDPSEFSQPADTIPLALLRLLGHCLEKRPENRFQSASDLAFALEALSGFSGSGSGSNPGAAAVSRTESGAVAVLPRAGLGKRLWIPLLIALLLASNVATYFVGVRQATKPLPSFHRLTFRRGQISTAKFAPDGQTIVYGATWEGRPAELFSTRTEGTESRSLGLTDASIQSISTSGEMAVMFMRDEKMVLARVPLAGGAPREVLENVSSAEWGPGGNDLAVVRWVGDRHRLEYPIGNVVYETTGVISAPRFSPQGDAIAFLERPAKASPTLSVAVVGLDGKKRMTAGEWLDARGVAWAKEGGEVWLSASEPGGTSTLHAVTIDGQDRLVMRMDGRVTLHDISREGRILVTRVNAWLGVSGRFPGQESERDLSWLDGSTAADISADGKTLLLTETGEGGGQNRSVYLRKTDGSPAVKLGEGNAQSLSPDGKWVLAIFPAGPQQLALLPTGAGERRVLPAGPITEYKGATWFPDGKSVLFVGREAGKGMRCYVQSVDGGEPRAVTPEGRYSYGSSVSPDGNWFFAYGEQERMALYPVNGGEPRPIEGLAANEFPIRWDADGRSLYIHEGETVPLRVSRFDPTTGRKETVQEIVPRDASTGSVVYNMYLTPDGRSFAYTYRRALADLSLIEGVS
jgi:eukaryotic-like serine/threonine-protein kinase